MLTMLAARAHVPSARTSRASALAADAATIAGPCPWARAQVVGTTHGGGGDSGGEEARGEGAEAGEVSGSEEGHEGAEDEQPGRAPRESIDGYEDRRDQQIGHVAPATPHGVGKKAEE